MDYLISFDTSTSPATVKQAVVEQWGLHPVNVFAGAAFELDSYSGPELDVIIQTDIAAGSEFGTELQADVVFAARCGFATELAIATELCLAIGTSAIIDNETLDPTEVTLITEDGWNGRVVLEPGELERGAFIIDYAFEPVPIMPHVPVKRRPGGGSGSFDLFGAPPLEFMPGKRYWDC